MSGSLRTFELYLDDGDGKPRFEPLTCASRVDVIPLIREMIETRNLVSVEVHEMGTPLFTIGR